MTIGTVLLLVTVGSLAVFTMVAMAFFHLRFSNAVVNQRSARNIAESALATALTRVWDDNHYGIERLDTQTVHLTSGTDEKAEAFLSFSKDQANSLGVPFSTNNFEAAASTEGGNGRVVPDSAVHLVALGICGGSRYKAEVLYYIPPYPNAMASSGPVISTGGLLVAGIPSVERAIEISEPTGFDPNELEPGHIVSNSPNGQAIFIGPDSSVRGDVVAVGGITISPDAEVSGEVRANASAQTVPDMEIDKIFQKLESVTTRDKILDPTLPDGTKVDYFTEASAPLVVKGNLLLDSGVLYCRDDLLVQGVVRGNGAIFSQGDIRIESGADLSADDQVALVAKGSLELNGTDKNSQFFNGLIYSEEEILAKNITVIGAAIVNGNSSSTLQLDNVSLVKSPVSVTLVAGLPSTPNLSTATNKPSNSKSSDLFTSTKKSYSFEPPAVEATLKSTLTGGIQLSGMKVPKKDGKSRFSVLFEGVLARGLGKIESVADLTDTEKTALDLPNKNYYFKDGRLYIRYDRLTGVDEAAIQKRYEEIVAELKAALPAPISYKIKQKKKKRVLFFKSSKTSYQNVTFDPSSGLSLDVTDYLKTLEGPNKEDKPGFIDLTLNRVIDPAEKSRVLLWQSF